MSARCQIEHLSKPSLIICYSRVYFRCDLKAVLTTMVDLSHRIHKSNRPLLLFTQVCFAISLPVAYVLSSYFQRGRFDQFFLNDAVDTPPVPGDFYPGPLGVHTFGDFLQPLWQSRLTPLPILLGIPHIYLGLTESFGYSVGFHIGPLFCFF